MTPAPCAGKATAATSPTTGVTGAPASVAVAVSARSLRADLSGVTRLAIAASAKPGWPRPTTSWAGLVRARTRAARGADGSATCRGPGRAGSARSRSSAAERLRDRSAQRASGLGSTPAPRRRRDGPSGATSPGGSRPRPRGPGARGFVRSGAQGPRRAGCGSAPRPGPRRRRPGRSAAAPAPAPTGAQARAAGVRRATATDLPPWPLETRCEAPSVAEWREGGQRASTRAPAWCPHRKVSPSPGTAPAAAAPKVGQGGGAPTATVVPGPPRPPPAPTPTVRPDSTTRALRAGRAPRTLRTDRIGASSPVAQGRRDGDGAGSWPVRLGLPSLGSPGKPLGWAQPTWWSHVARPRGRWAPCTVAKGPKGVSNLGPRWPRAGAPPGAGRGSEGDAARRAPGAGRASQGTGELRRHHTCRAMRRNGDAAAGPVWATTWRGWAAAAVLLSDAPANGTRATVAERARP